MARTAAHIRCPACGKTVPAPRLDWDEITERVTEVTSEFWVDEDAWNEEWAEEFDEGKRVWKEERRQARQDLAMGPHYWQTEPPVHYYRRMRKRSNCQRVYPTAEVDEGVLRELDSLRELQQAVDSEAARAASAVNKIRRLLKA